MNPDCKKGLDREVLIKLLPRAWINKEYRVHRESSLLDRERAMLPSTTPHVEQTTARRANHILLENLRHERQTLRQQLHENSRSIDRVQNNLTPALKDTGSTFVQRCCVDGCRGFLSAAWKCSTCDTYSCSNCHAPKRGRDDTDHRCDANAVETVKLLRTDSKKCPKCAIYITKLEGCDQMWCPQCATAFSWRTGRIINSGIHNPHYFEALRRNGAQGRDHADVPCGGLPTARELHLTFQNAKVDSTYALRTMRLVNHIEHVEAPRYPTEPRHDSNVDLRVLYLLNELSDEEFRSKLQRREKDFQKKRDFGLVYQMLQNTLSDELRRCVLEKASKNDEFIHRTSALVDYANEAFRTVCKRYECRGPTICKATMRNF